MKTERLAVDPNRLGDPAAIDVLDRAAAILRAGGLIAFPTETVYGLGANVLDRAAVERIFVAKNRPAWDPVIVHIANAAMLDGLVAEIPDAAQRLIDKFWPGPLTFLLPRSPAVPDAVTAGRPLVGVRMPEHPVALAVIRMARVPVAAPSANLFSHISPTTAAHVLADLDGRIDAVLDAGPTEHGVESTVLDPCQSPMVIYRPGAVTAEQIREIAGPVEFFRERSEPSEMPQEALPSPGVGLRHYAPKARLLLVEAPPQILGARLAEIALQLQGETIGFMLPSGISVLSGLTDCKIFPWGEWSKPEEMARDLYAGLRKLDDEACSVILCPLPPQKALALRSATGYAKRQRPGPETKGL